MKKKVVDYYKILRVDMSSDTTQIKKAYRHLVLEKHPDVCKVAGANSDFMMIIQAYNVLKDVNKRKVYDEELLSSKSFLEKINFKYNEKATKIKDKVFNKLGIIFKNISWNNGNRSNIDIDIPQEVISMSENMSLDELEMRLSISDNVFVRSYAAIALGLKNDRRAWTALETALNDDELIVRQRAVWALGRLGMKKSLPMLEQMYYNAGSKLKEDIIVAISKISGNKEKLLCKIKM